MDLAIEWFIGGAMIAGILFTIINTKEHDKRDIYERELRNELRNRNT